jgi:chaperonin GroES
MGYARDKASRKQWEDRNDAAMNLAMQVSEPKNFPWPGCSNVVFPLVTIAALQFSARAYANMIQGTQVVRYRVIGKESPVVRERAMRIGKHMSWQLLEEDESWEEQHDRLLINLSIVGTNFVKSYYSPSKGYPISELVLAKDLVIHYYAKSVETAQRKTHRIPLDRNEIYERAASGVFCDVRKEEWFDQAPSSRPDLNDIRTDKRLGMTPPPPDDYTPHYFLEQHTLLDLDGDGYAEPYIATIEEQSHKLCRLVARVGDESAVERRDNKILRIKPTEYFTKYSFIPSPDGGIYDLGFGVFLGPINAAVDAGINQLIDFGTMQNSNGGFLGRGAKIRGGVYTFKPNEWKRVDSTGDDLRKNIVPYPERQSNDVMFKLLGLLIEYSNRIAGTVDATVGENPGQNTPASTYQGMTEQGMQIFSMTFKRFWRSMKEELKRRYDLNREYMPVGQKNFGPGDDFIRREDYTGNPDQIAPVANPRITSTVMRVNQAIIVKQASAATPGYDIAEVEKSFLESIEIEGIERVYPGPGKVPPEHTMPNPKAMVEQMKLQAKQLDIRSKQLEWANRLMEERRVNDAKIRLMEAQALKAASEANAADAAQKIEAFNQLIEMHKSYGEQMQANIKALLGGGSGEDSNGGGVRDMEDSSSQRDDSSVSLKVPGGSNVSVGNGSVPKQ